MCLNSCGVLLNYWSMRFFWGADGVFLPLSSQMYEYQQSDREVCANESV